MHRLLIVDDDEIMRAGITNNIDWQANGISVVGTAHNGQECLEMIPACLPDIILTDIKMPYMDGIQCTEAVYRLYPQIKVVLLTAYDDFKYAQMALNYKVCQYVMKYEDNSEILNAVLKAAKEYDDHKGNKEIVQKSRELLVNKFFYDMIVDCQDDEIINQRSEQLNINFESTLFRIMSVSISKSNMAGSSVMLWQEKQLCDKAGVLFQRYLNRGNVKTFYFIDDIRLNLLANFIDDNALEQNQYFVSLKNAVQAIEKEMNIELYIGAGTFYDGFKNISKSHSEAVQALEFRNIVHAEHQDENKIIFYEEIKNSNVSHMAVLKQIISFIGNNYQKEDLSMNSIANEVHLTPSYISTLFKKFQGVNISDYIIDIRIKKAIELLESTDYKTYEISEKIGYSNPQYFSVLFKRTVGISPIEYRKTHTKE